MIRIIIVLAIAVIAGVATTSSLLNAQGQPTADPTGLDQMNATTTGTGTTTGTTSGTLSPDEEMETMSNPNDAGQGLGRDRGIVGDPVTDEGHGGVPGITDDSAPDRESSGTL